MTQNPQFSILLLNGSTTLPDTQNLQHLKANQAGDLAGCDPCNPCNSCNRATASSTIHRPACASAFCLDKSRLVSLNKCEMVTRPTPSNQIQPKMGRGLLLDKSLFQDEKKFDP